MNLQTKTPTLGLIGVGLMGTALAERTLAAGFPVLGYDLISDRTDELQNLGGIATRSAAEVVQKCDWLIYSVMTTEEVQASIDECQDSLRPGQIVIDTSTGEPDGMCQLASRLSQCQVDYLDATIAGNSVETRRGEVLALVGGDQQAFERCKPFFDCFAKQTFHLGPSGYGARMKLVFNLVLGLHRAVLGEALVFAEKVGIAREVALDILKQGTTYSFVMDNKGSKMLARDFVPQAKLGQHLKDVNLILQLGIQYGAKLPLSSQHQKILHQLVTDGHDALDNSAVIKGFE